MGTFQEHSTSGARAPPRPRRAAAHARCAAISLRFRGNCIATWLGIWPRLGPPASRLALPPSTAFSTRLRRPGALQLPRSTEDRVFEISLDLPRNRGLGPLPVRRTLLAIDCHGQRIGMQRPGQDEDIDPIPEIRVARRRVPVGNDRAGQRIFRGVLDEIERVVRRLPQDRAYRSAGLRSRIFDGFLLGQTEHRPDRRFGVDALGLAR